jgi:hypothetical protein
MLITGCSTGNDDPIENPDPGDNNPVDNPEDEIPSGNLGDGDLVLEGKIYTETLHPHPNYTAEYNLYSDSGVVRTIVEGFGSLGEGTLSDGEFKITITKKPTTGLLNSDQFNKISAFWGLENETILVPDFQFAQIRFFEKSMERGIQKRESILSDTSPWTIYIFVDYLYVDTDATVVLEEKTHYDPDVSGLAYTQIFKKTTLDLKKGWNALTTRWVEEGTATTYSHTTTVSVENPDLRWVIYQ